MIDGVRFTNASGQLYEAFVPRWWRVDRWLYWLFTRRAKGNIAMSIIEGGPTGRRFVTKTIRVLGVGTEL